MSPVLSIGESGIKNDKGMDICIAFIPYSVRIGFFFEFSSK